MFDLISFSVLLLFVINVVVFVNAHTKNKNKKYSLSSGVLFLISYIWVYLLKIDLNPNIDTIFSRFINRIQNTSINTQIIIFIILFLCTLIVTIKYMTQTKYEINPASIKESMDNLPMGLAYFEHSGFMILSNNIMDSLSRSITGDDLYDGNLLWKSILESSNLINDDINNPIIQVANGDTWSFKQKTFTSENISGRQIKAININSLNHIRQELKIKNKEFLEMNQRLLDYSENLSKVKIEEERLKIKSQLHNELGHAVLATRRLMSDNHNDGSIARIWKDITQSFLDGSSFKEKDEFENLYEAAKEIGIEFILLGEVPKNQNIKGLIIKASIESLNNAVKHGDASELILEITKEESMYIISFKNNGKLPNKVEFGGGLSSLQKYINDFGGKMKIEINDSFNLIIYLPDREEKR